MLEIVRNMYGLQIREIYFASTNVESDKRRDVDAYIQCGMPIAGAFGFGTATVDLQLDIEALDGNIGKGFRYEIRRAGLKDGLNCIFDESPSVESLAVFKNFYDRFACYRKLSKANSPKLELFRRSGNLMMASVKVGVPNSAILAMHCYITDGERARLYYSATMPRDESSRHDQQLVGRANKLLHWETMLAMKRLAIKTYDFGGISKGSALKGIDDFKLQFGGVEREEFNALVGVSWKGRLALGARNMLQQLGRK